MSPNPVRDALIRRGTFGHREAETQREDDHVKREVEIRILLSQPGSTKDCQQLPETGERQGRILSLLGGGGGLPTS